MRDLLNLFDTLAEAALTPAEITKYPKRFDAFIDHIQNSRPFYTKDGQEIVLEPSEADRFLQLNSEGKFKGSISGLGIDGNNYPLSAFVKTAEFGGQSVKPGEDTSQSKEAALVKPSQIGITDQTIPADGLADVIIGNPVLASTLYGQAIIKMAQDIVNGQPATIPADMAKNTALKKAIVDYAGEYLGVLAIVYNQTNFPNKKDFLKWLGGSINQLILNFPSEINNPLADSFAEIVNPETGHQINISSKGTGGGAPPSISGLKVPEEVRSKKAYQTAVDFIDICQDKSLPKPTTISQVFEAMNLFYERMPDRIPDQFKQFLPWPNDITKQVQASLKNKTPMPEYSELFADLQSAGSDGGKLTYVTKAAVMNIVNGGDLPEFQSAVLEILDYNFIQQYTKVEGRSGVLKFDTQWPAKLNGVITLETKSGGTDPTKGGFSFKLGPSSGIGAYASDGEESSTQTVSAKTGAEELDTATQKRAGLKASAGGVETPKKFSKKALGRDYQK